MVKRSALVRINGMNSNLVGWGFEDIDLLIRLGLLAKLAAKRIGSAYHLAHDDSIRTFSGSSLEESENRNSEICMANYRRV